VTSRYSGLSFASLTPIIFSNSEGVTLLVLLIDVVLCCLFVIETTLFVV